MPPELPPPERNWFSWSRLCEPLAVLCFVLVMLALLFPAFPCCGPDRKRVQARIDIMNLVGAIKYYNIEYGYFPPLNTGNIEDEPTQARLIRILQGRDVELNPRKVVFLEARTARNRGSWLERKYEEGIHPESGVFINPWGKPYRIRLATTDGGKIRGPYKTGEEISSPALAWSLGKDGVQGSPGKENVLEDSDDVVSWR